VQGCPFSMGSDICCFYLPAKTLFGALLRFWAQPGVFRTSIRDLLNTLMLVKCSGYFFSGRVEYLKISFHSCRHYDRNLIYQIMHIFRKALCPEQTIQILCENRQFFIIFYAPYLSYPHQNPPIHPKSLLPACIPHTSPSYPARVFPSNSTTSV
jgi:hypothetical protein